MTWTNFLIGLIQSANNWQLNISGACKQAERKFGTSTAIPDSDNADVGIFIIKKAKISAREFSPDFFEVVILIENANIANGVLKTLGHIDTILEHPDASFALLGVLLLIIFGLHLRHVKFEIHIFINISLMLTLAMILSEIRLYHLPQGGSVTLGGLIPLLLISFRYGAGVLFGLLTIIQDPLIVHPVQVLFDYPLPVMAIGLAGIFHEKIFLGTILAFAGNFICHFISGVVFFASYAPEGTSPVMYSLVTNATYIVPELIICLVILKILPVKRLLAAMDRTHD